MKDAAALPPMLTSTATVRAGDFNGDGRPDLFVGGRLTPRSYPYPTRSYVLRNDGGYFTDVTEQVAPELVHTGGMITDAAWVDFDGDGRLDLVTVGEWMPIQFFRNEGKLFRNVTESTHLPPMRGWWYSLAVGDFDHDGRPDLVVDNLGLNYTSTTSKDNKFGIYAAHFTATRARVMGAIRWRKWRPPRRSSGCNISASPIIVAAPCKRADWTPRGFACSWRRSGS